MMNGYWYLAIPTLNSLLILVLPTGDLRAAAAFVLLWVLPGWAWGRALHGRWLVGFGLGIAVNLLLALLLSALPGSVSYGLSLAVFTLAALLPLLVAVRSVPALPALSAAALVPLLAVLLTAEVFRVPNLGYSEFQGDEGVIMVRAAMAIEGNEEQLFLHEKGPAEILIPLATWRLSGGIEEFWARLPFAWLGLLGVAAVVQLGVRWFDRRAGWIAGLVVAISGLHIAFARIVQYQGYVVYVGLAALLVLDDYRREGRTRDLLLGALLTAMSAWGHYDALLLFPAAAVLALRWTPGQPWKVRALLANRAYLYALLLGLAVLALFYVPYVLHPNFAKTLSYLTQDRVQGEGGGLHFNAEKIWGVSTLYNSTYYYVLLVVLVFTSVFTVRRYRLSPYAWLTFGVPFAFYLFVVGDPRTHVYTFYAGAALLAGGTLSALWEVLGRRWWRWAVLALGAGLYVLCAGYAWMLYVDHTPEYVRTFPENKSPLYWTSYNRIFRQGLFGFPYRVGWQAIGALMAEGQIAGLYASNEEQEITDWYTRQAPRTHCPRPDVYVVAEDVQDKIYVDKDEIEREYALSGEVLVNGRPRIRWFTRSPDVPFVVDQAAYRQWWRPEEVVPPTSGWTHGADATLGDRVQLVGYDLDESEAVPGGWVEVTLYWRPLMPLQRNYQVFAHLYDGQLWAQHDGAPECTINATTRWEPGHIVPDPHRLPLPADVPVGPMPLLVGMYDLLTLERLPVPGTADNAIYLADVNIRAN